MGDISRHTVLSLNRLYIFVYTPQFYFFQKPNAFFLTNKTEKKIIFFFYQIVTPPHIHTHSGQIMGFRGLQDVRQ